MSEFKLVRHRKGNGRGIRIGPDHVLVTIGGKPTRVTWMRSETEVLPHPPSDEEIAMVVCWQLLGGETS